MTKRILRRISVGSVFRVSFFLYWLVGLIFTAFYGVAFLAFSSVLPSLFFESEVPRLGGLFGGLGAVAIFFVGFFAALCYAVFSAIATAIACWAYNALAGVIGGIEVTLEAPPGAHAEHPVPIDSVPIDSVSVDPGSVASDR